MIVFCNLEGEIGTLLKHRDWLLRNVSTNLTMIRKFEMQSDNNNP